MIEFWTAAIVIFLIIEAATVGLASIWFAIGSVAALVSAAFGAPIWLQAIWFLVISGVTIWFTRPIAKKYINTKRHATNADRVIGMNCVVSEAIDNVTGAGAVMIDGRRWKAKSRTGKHILEGTFVTVTLIEGVKLIVEPAEEVVESGGE